MVGKTKTSVDSKKPTTGDYLEQLTKIYKLMFEKSEKNIEIDDLIQQFKKLQPPALSFTPKQNDKKSKLLGDIQNLIDQSQVKSSDNPNSQKEEAIPVMQSVTSNDEAQSNETDIDSEETTRITGKVASFDENERIENLNPENSGSEDNEEVTIILNQNKIQPTEEIFPGYTKWCATYGKTHPVLNKNLNSCIKTYEETRVPTREQCETNKVQILKCMNKAINGRSKWWYFTQDGKKELLEEAKKRFDDDPCSRNLQIFLAICQAHRTSRENSLFPHAETSSFSAFKKALPEELKKQMFNEEPKQNLFNIWGKK